MVARVALPILPRMNIADLRKSYEKAELSESASHADPLKPVSYTHLTLPTNREV